ncbi:agouti-related protein-like isoform X2 [Echeneis naucrates]|uniref:agouti-related protein-like isoform X2 n=1 Tax=Echeneis naucrates TaxID=173247 RepID=UPI001113CC77|nr:agouti-related protein-like isoform X2 [Echeneis naucrates]
MSRTAFCLFLLLMTSGLGSAGLLARNNLQGAYSALSSSRNRDTQTPGLLNQGRQRPLFARRGQYERQSVPSRVVPVPPKHGPPLSPPPPPKVTAKPVKLKCSHRSQSCTPQSGCCEPYTTCHCRFFSAICFCRKTK